VILAHQGGWDEMLLVAGPIAVIVWLLSLAQKRAERNRAQFNASPDEDPGSEDLSTEDSHDARTGTQD
jgi:hypothetical protein